MALKDSWVDKKDGDYILAEDINAVAHGVIDIEENLPETIDEKLGEAKESGEFDGKDGLSAYELALENGTTTAQSEAEWLASLKGADGGDGLDGERGLAYYRLKSNLVGSLEYYPFADFLIPEGYVPKPYDLVLYNDGNLGYISSVNTHEQLATVSHIPNATLKGPAGDAGYSPTVSVSKKDGVATISITDESGTQTVQIYDGAAGSGTGGGGDWDVNSPSVPGYIKNRTHSKEIVGTVIFSESSLAFADTLGSFTMAELADSIELEEGKTYKVSWGGVDYTCIAQKDPVVDTGLYLGNGRDINGTASAEPFLIRTTKEGSYDSSSGKTEIRNYDQTSAMALEISGDEETIYHQLDPRYIPDMYYTEERNDVEILPTSTAINTGVSVMGEKYVIGDAIALVEGKTYKVTYNGVEYESIASVVTIQSENDGIGLGDVGILATGSPSGNYPFVLIVTKAMAEQGASVAVISLDGSSSITVSIVGYGEIAHKIPEKYLPDNVLAGTINIEENMGELLENGEVSLPSKEFADRVRGVARNRDKMLLIGDNNGIHTEFLLTKTKKLGIGDNNFWEFGAMFSSLSEGTIIPYYISLHVNDTEDAVEIKVTVLTPAN